LGKIMAISTSQKRGTIKIPQDQVRVITNYGLEGDAHAGNWHRQVSLLSYQKYLDFCTNHAKVCPGEFGENLLVDGFDFKTFSIGTLFFSKRVILEITQIGKKCHSHCDIFDRVGHCIMPTEGVFARVVSGGVIHKGDTFELYQGKDEEGVFAMAACEAVQIRV